MNGGLNIIHADAHLVVVDKPAGLLAVPGRGPDKQDCIESRLRLLFPVAIEQPAVHRLDMATSGLMVLALDRATHRDLGRQFAARQVEKRYVAVLEGEVKGTAGRIELAFRLDPDNRPYQVFDPLRGKLGVSDWRLLEVVAGRSRVEFVPHTVRTHQLRLHAAHFLGLGCPIVGDTLYGHGKTGERMLLHASGLRFVHPGSGRWLGFKSMPDF